MSSTNCGKQGDRGSALWGSGSKGGNSRSNALWGKGGRGAMLAVVAIVAMALPLVASAARTKSKDPGTTYVSPELLALADNHSKGTVNVIIQSADGVDGAKKAIGKLGLDGQEKKTLKLVGAVTASIRVDRIDDLAKTDGLIVTPDAPTHGSASPWSSGQIWPYESGAAGNWANDVKFAANMPAIAIVDSGIQDRADFSGRIVASVNLSSLPNNSPGDGRGHGTFVAGIAADSAAGYAGAAPAAKLVSIDVMDDNGMGLTSDIIAACQWILDHQAQYNIRVANFSLHSTINAPFYYDPLDLAVEKLWFNGIVVVAAAGNYGIAGAPSGVLYSPGDDPFVITVGAADLGGTPKPKDDSIAPWSAWGFTIDGFAKPEVSAPGRYMIGPVPESSTLVADKPGNVKAPGYIQLSGTSFATPVVSGAAAQILARHPNFSPDQVKGALMMSARDMPEAVGSSAGVGEITANKAANMDNPPNPNKALDQFVKSNRGNGNTNYSFDAASWVAAVKSSASWNSASWVDASWLSASWNSASWNSASWNTASWNSASWLSASWNSASWLSASYEDAAEGDAAADPSAYTLDASGLADLLSDPSLGLDPSVLPSP